MINFLQATINDLPVGRDVDEALRLVQAFQFVDKNGEGKFLSLTVFILKNRIIVKSFMVIYTILN